MKKITALALSLTFLGVTAAPVFAQTTTPDPKLVAACKDKKKGDAVKVDGKDMKCP
jgi:hypothetical protein